MDYRITSFKYIPYSEILFFLIVLLWLIYIDFETIKEKVIKDKVSTSFLLLILLFFIGLFWSEDIINSVVIFKTVMYFFIVPILLTVYEKKYLKLMLVFLLLFSVLTSLATIILYITSYSNSFELKLSLISPFINHMYYGTILSMALVYFLVNIKFKDEKYLIVIKFFSIVVILTAMALICNRSSLIGLFVAISFYIWIDKNSLSKIKRVFLILISIFLIISFVSKINSNCGVKFLNAQKNMQKEVAGNRTGTSLGCRLNYIESSIDLIKENIFVGVGTGDSISSMRKLYGEEGYKNLVTKPCSLGKHNQIFYFDNHNMYLTMLMLFGPVGLGLFLFLFYSIYNAGKKIDSWELKLTTIIVVLSSIPITLFYTSSNFVLFFSLYIGIIYAYKKEKKYNENS